MKEKLKRYAGLLSEGLRTVALRHPVELVLIVASAVGMLLSVELDWSRDTDAKLWMLAVFALVALVVGTLAGPTAWRKVYYVSWTPLIPLLCWPGLRDWMTTMPFVVSVAILLPLALLMSSRATNNRRFVCDAVILVRSALLAALFANIALGLFQAILWSTAYIFGFADALWVDHLARDVSILAELLVVPVLFLMMLDRWTDGVCRNSRMLEVLLDYIVTPALMIYAAILYLYMAKIILHWTLPEGGVAYMVFAFALLTLFVRAMQSLSEKRFGEWFYRLFSLVVLPAAILFWAGAARRIGEYGLTEPRIYLVVCGFLMSFAILLFISRRTGRYLYLCLAAFVCFGAMAYVPGLHPERIALRSQERRVERIAASLGRLGEDGRLLRTPIPLADTARREQYRELYESLEYLERDKAAARFGLEELSDFEELFPDGMRDYVVYGIYNAADTSDDRQIAVDLPENAEFKVAGAYSRVYQNLNYWSGGYRFANDTLYLFLGEDLPVLEIPAAELLEAQLAKSGFRPSVDSVPTEGQRLDLLDYRTERCRILFEQLRIERPDSLVRLADVSISTVWMR